MEEELLITKEEVVFDSFEKDRDYRYTVIEEFALKNEIDIQEYGPDEIAKNIIILEEGFKTLTFLLTGFAGQSIYTLIYKQ